MTMFAYLTILALAATASPAPPPAGKASASATATIRIVRAAAITAKPDFQGQTVHRRETQLPDSAGALRPAVIYDFE